MNKKFIVIFFIIILTVFLKAQDKNVERIVNNVTKFLGGEKFLNYKTYYAHGKLYIIKGSLSARMDVWEYTLFPYLFRQALEDKENGDIEIINLKNLNGIHIKYGKKSKIGMDEISNFKIGLRKDIHYIFKYIIPQKKASIFYLSPEDIEGPTFNEGLKLVFPDNDEVKIILKEDSYVPYKIIYKKKEGLAKIKWEKILARWFRIDGIEIPKRIEYYREGIFTYLIEYEKIRFNKNLDKKLFRIY